MIFVSNRLIINGLSVAIVTVPPLRGRIGGGWSDYVVLLCLRSGTTANCFQPPPSLPRRGGTDTIGYIISLVDV